VELRNGGAEQRHAELRQGDAQLGSAEQGMKLLSADEVLEEVRQRRGGKVKMEADREPLFVCFGGWVRCVDGDRHYIPASRVAELHGLSPSAHNVILVNKDDQHKLLGLRLSDCVVLGPSEAGIYPNMVKARR